MITEHIMKGYADGREIGVTYRKRRLKKVAKRCGLDVGQFRAYAMAVKKLRKRLRKVTTVETL